MATYYGNWRSEPFTCKACSWHCLGAELQPGEMFDALYEAECPTCSTVLAVVSYPTIAESLANWKTLSAAERCEVEVVENFNKRFETLALRKPDQLPELEGDPLILEWDFDRDDGNATVIRHGSVEVWREPALWEGYERFCEVLDILVARYGRRLWAPA
jgi:hypothetical protein